MNRDDDMTGLPGLPPEPAPVVPRGAQMDLFAPGGAGTECRRYLATWILNSGSHCGQCGSREIFVQRQPYIAKGRPRAHIGAWCAGDGCGGRHIKWLDKAEKKRWVAHGGVV